MKIIMLLVYLAVLYGWVCNLFAVVHGLIANDPFTPLLVGRIVGIPVFVLGAILGFF